MDQEPTFLSQELRLAMRDWWLAIPTKKANTPNWDIAAEAHSAGRQTLVLVEAKAHENEFSSAGKPGNGNPHNHWKIAQAIEAASADLNAVMPGWRLSHDHCYQLANRFAWAWKLASLGMDVVLVYLGFLNCEEMQDCGPVFRNEDTWQQLVRTHARGCVPEAAWEQRLRVGAGSVTPLIRTDEIALAWPS